MPTGERTMQPTWPTSSTGRTRRISIVSDIREDSDTKGRWGLLLWHFFIRSTRRMIGDRGYHSKPGPGPGPTRLPLAEFTVSHSVRLPERTSRPSTRSRNRARTRAGHDSLLLRFGNNATSKSIIFVDESEIGIRRNQVGPQEMRIMPDSERQEKKCNYLWTD
jgi:hypothetical protein